MGKVFVTRRIPSVGIERLASLHDVEVWEGQDPPPRDLLLEKVRGCSGVLSMLSDKIDAQLMDSAGPSLRGIANFAVGYNNIDFQAAKDRSVQVGNTPGVLTNATADIAVGLILAAGRCFGPAIGNVQRFEWRNWEPMMFLGQEFEGKTLGIVGMGRIGHAVAKRMHGGWGMRIVYTARDQKPEAESSFHATRLGLDDLLRQSDVVSLHCPLTDQTRNLIGARELGLMKSNAVLVNTARGEVIDQAALADALSQRRIFAAGLDVTTPEPIDRSDPLRSQAQCLILPHIGSATQEARDQMATMAANNLIAAIEGQPMPFGVTR
ncbi:MAG: 2-hydroxyacid dehydrogenase [Planctomycetota bacterium]